ncbi:DUF1289 domain-containing protein [Haloarcula sp. CBA1122]|nr:DUF1289 domain-containing protein [Haloarcula sp. CBA1122]
MSFLLSSSIGSCSTSPQASLCWGCQRTSSEPTI